MHSAVEIEIWLRRYIADLTGVAPDAVKIDASFDRLGLDSASAVALVGDMEDWLGIEIDPTLPYDHPTIRQLSNVLGEMLREVA